MFTIRNISQVFDKCKIFTEKEQVKNLLDEIRYKENVYNKKVLENVSIDLYENELVCILGVSGAGKTTLFNIVAGLLEPDGGNVEMDGENINGKCGKVSYMLQKDLLLPHKRIIDNVALPLVIKGENKKDPLKNIKLITEGGVRYSVPAIINPENMEDRIVVRFRVGGIYQNMYESVYVNDRRIIHKKRQILAPGEMESLEIKKSDLKDAKSILITLEEG